MITSSSSTIRISAVLASKARFSYSSGPKHPQYKRRSSPLHSFNMPLTRDVPSEGTRYNAAQTESGRGSSLGDEGSDRDGAHRAHLRHRPQLGRRLRARDPRDRG